MYKYVIAKAYIPNCPSCDGSSFHGNIYFFNTIEELKESLLKDINQYEYFEIYNFEGQVVGEIGYSFGFHHVTGISISFCGEEYRTMDNGSGKLIWQNKDDA